MFFIQDVQYVVQLISFRKETILRNHKKPNIDINFYDDYVNLKPQFYPSCINFIVTKEVMMPNYSTHFCYSFKILHNLSANEHMGLKSSIKLLTRTVLLFLCILISQLVLL